MLIEVILCAIAVLVFSGGLIATPILIIKKRAASLLIVKRIQQAMIVCVPWILHLPCAVAYYRGAQLIGHMPIFHYDHPSLWKSDWLFQSIYTNTIATSLVYKLITEHFTAVVTFIFVAPAVLVFMVPQTTGARLREYKVTTVLLVVAWVYICLFSPSYDWWWG